jgi:hypothetical protein
LCATEPQARTHDVFGYSDSVHKKKTEIAFFPNAENTEMSPFQCPTCLCGVGTQLWPATIVNGPMLQNEFVFISPKSCLQCSSCSKHAVLQPVSPPRLHPVTHYYSKLQSCLRNSNSKTTVRSSVPSAPAAPLCTALSLTSHFGVDLELVQREEVGSRVAAVQAVSGLAVCPDSKGATVTSCLCHLPPCRTGWHTHALTGSC